MRNRAVTIEKALQSAVSQDPLFELLVFDGGSTDGTVDVIRRYESNITFWRSFPDGNATYGLNEGVTWARGDIICLLAGDDWLESGALRALREKFIVTPGLEVLSCGVRMVYVDAEGTVHEGVRFADESILKFTMRNIVRHALTCGRFIRREVYSQLGGHNPPCTYPDLDFLIRLKSRGARSGVLPQVVYTYRRHSGSRTTAGSPAAVMDMMREQIRVSEEYLAHVGLDPADRSALLGSHGRAFARLAWMQFICGDLGAAGGLMIRAWRLNSAWPICLPFWLMTSLLNKRVTKTMNDNGRWRLLLAGVKPVMVERWSQHYNQIRPHSVLNDRPPAPETTISPSSKQTSEDLFGLT